MITNIIFWLGIIWGSTVVFFLLFLVFAAYQGAVKAGRIVPKFSKGVIAPVLLFGAILDVFWNYTVGSLLFLQFPKIDESGFPSYTFTHRLIQLKKDQTWRGNLARFFAQQLNWADPDHV